MVQYAVRRVVNGTECFMVSFDFAKTPITEIADTIIIDAAHKGTSDIHFDPRENGMMVRFRIDGDCQDYTLIPKAYEKNLSTRLKLLANMNITESRLPQDGAIKGQFGDQFLDMRVSCLPTNEGEKIVIRILDYSRSLQGIDSLNFHPDNLVKIKRMSQVPNGIILVTGATGSGKSTTTYSMLSGLNKPETNIITVEDPVEMNIEGINQVQVNADIGMTFAAALRSILRQDPNVILIGEIRDSETAKIAIRASITGHLVLSTLHTNNALATIERLLDMDVERYLLSTALTGIISQRLAKKLCPYCRIKRETTKYEKKIFKKYLNKDVDVIWDKNPKGCKYCRNGYKGRVPFHEVLELDEEIRTALNNEKLEKKDLIKMVYTPKTITMLQDALIKNYEGQTTFEEVYKSIEIENEDENYVPPTIEIPKPKEMPKKVVQPVAPPPTPAIKEITNINNDNNIVTQKPIKPINQLNIDNKDKNGKNKDIQLPLKTDTPNKKDNIIKEEANTLNKDGQNKNIPLTPNISSNPLEKQNILKEKIVPTIPTNNINKPFAPTIPTNNINKPIAPTIPTNNINKPIAPTIPTNNINKPIAPTIPTNNVNIPIIPTIKPNQEINKPIAPTIPTNNINKPFAPTIQTNNINKPFAPTIQTNNVNIPIIPTIKPNQEINKPIAPTIQTNNINKPITPTIPTNNVNKPIIPTVKPNQEINKPIVPTIPTNQNLNKPVMPNISIIPTGNNQLQVNKNNQMPIINQ